MCIQKCQAIIKNKKIYWKNCIIIVYAFKFYLKIYTVFVGLESRGILCCTLIIKLIQPFLLLKCHTYWCLHLELTVLQDQNYQVFFNKKSWTKIIKKILIVLTFFYYFLELKFLVKIYLMLHCIWEVMCLCIHFLAYLLPKQF